MSNFVNPLEYVQRKLSRVNELFQGGVDNLQTVRDAQGNAFRPQGRVTKTNRSLPPYYVPGSGYYDGNTGAFLGPAPKKGAYTASDRKNADPVTGYSSPAPRDYRSGAPIITGTRGSRGVSGAAGGKTVVKNPGAYGDQQVNFTITPWNQSFASNENAQLLQPAPDALSAYATQKQGELAALGMPTSSVDVPNNVLGMQGGSYNVVTGIKLPSDIKPSAYGTSAVLGMRSGTLRDTWNVSAQQDAYMARLQNAGSPISTGSSKVDTLANDLGWKKINELGGLTSERGMSYARADLLIRANRIKDPNEREAFLAKGRQYLENTKSQEMYGVNTNVKIENSSVSTGSQIDPATAQAAKFNVPPMSVGKANSGSYGLSPTAGMAAQQTRDTLQPGSPTAPVSNAAPVGAPTPVSRPDPASVPATINPLQMQPYNPNPMGNNIDEYVKNRKKLYGPYAQYADMFDAGVMNNPYLQQAGQIGNNLGVMANDRFYPSIQSQRKYLGY